MQQIVNDSLNQEVQPELFAKLSLMERSVWMLYSNEGFSEAEMSEITGLAEDEVQQMLIGIRHKLYPMTVQLLPSRKKYWLSAAAIFIGLVCSTFLYLQNTKTIEESNGIVKTDQTIIPQGGTPVQQNNAQPGIRVVPQSTIKTPVKQTVNFSKLPAPSIAPSVIVNVFEQVLEKQDVTPGSIVNLTEFKPDILPLQMLQTGIQPPVSMQSTPPIYPLSGIALSDNTQTVKQSSTTFQKLRLALTPNSFPNTDERVSIAMLLPGIFLSGE
jgi:hypothetical protein